MVLQNKGYGAYIVCDNAPLTEYAITQEDETTVSCFVCSETGKSFRIHFEDYGFIENTVEAALVDGKLSKSVMFLVDGKRADSVSSQYGMLGSSLGFRLGAGDISLYEFQNVITTDDDKVAHRHDPRHQDLGCIEVRIARTLYSYPDYTIMPSPMSIPGYNGSTVVHERAKKLSAQCVGGGNTIQVQHGGYCRSVPYDRIVYAKFRFYYRKSSILQAQGIIPIPLPPPAQIKRTAVKREYESDDDEQDEESDTSEEQSHVRAQVALAQAKLDHAKAKMDLAKAKLKLSRAKSDEGTASKHCRKKIKREPSPIRMPSGSNVIDLS